jgi:glycosyltransferase involved in cell wall biosynthesis
MISLSKRSGPLSRRKGPPSCLPRRILIIVQNLPVPFDRRVWLEATTLKRAGYVVSVICPKGPGYEKAEETIEGVHIYRHNLPIEARGSHNYLLEYAAALFWEFVLSIKVARRHGFDVIHACNPPDLIFLVALFFRLLFGTKFIFDHHDVNPELYEAKFGRRDVFWWLLLQAEKLTFKAADISIATNESYRQIAIRRGHMRPADVFVVRSSPDLNRMARCPPDLRWRNGRAHMVGYVGVISEIEGLDLLLASIEHIVRQRQRNDIQFVVAGTGPEWQAIVALCKTMGLDDWVTFAGRVDDKTLFEILSTADVCVNPDRVSAMSDISTMNKIMEYMAFEKPIVQFDVKEGRYSAGDASVYARANDPLDFAEKVIDLIDDAEKRQRMGQFGRRRVTEALAWEQQQAVLLEAYDALFRLPCRVGLYRQLGLLRSS